MKIALLKIFSEKYQAISIQRKFRKLYREKFLPLAVTPWFDLSYQLIAEVLTLT